MSFIIASIDRDQELQQCITSIEKAHEYRQDISIEILVVIQKTKQEKKINIRYPQYIAFYYIDGVGLSLARNFAIGKCKGDYLVFIDDDATISETFIEILLKNISRFNNVNAFCGKLIDSAQNIPFSPLFLRDKVKKLNRFDYQYFMGSAHVLSRRVINKIGCYDENFGVGAKYYGSEESDIFFRLKAANEHVLYLPDLIFFHPIPKALPLYVYNYAYAFGAVLTKSSLNDKAYLFVYGIIAMKIAAKAFIRILQKLLLKGIYKEKDEKYHYSSVLNGTFQGIKDFICRESSS